MPGRGWPAGTALVLRRSRRGCTLHSLRLIVLLHYGVSRLVTIVLALQRLLLFRARIAIP